MLTYILLAVLGFVLGTVIYRQIRGGAYWVQYKNMAYDGGGSANWTSKYKCRLFAAVAKTYYQKFQSWGGTTIMTSYDPDKPMKVMKITDRPD